MTVLQWGDVVVDVDLPSTVELTIANTEPGLAGDRANPGKKPAELETGASIRARRRGQSALYVEGCCFGSFPTMLSRPGKSGMLQ